MALTYRVKITYHEKKFPDYLEISKILRKTKEHPFFYLGELHFTELGRKLELVFWEHDNEKYFAKIVFKYFVKPFIVRYDQAISEPEIPTIESIDWDGLDSFLPKNIGIIPIIG